MAFLDSVQLAYSCPLRWEKLLGSNEKRFCMDCQKHVTNLSAMTRPQAQAYLDENADAPICVRVEVDAKGRAIHRPGLSAAAAVALTLSAVACGGDDDSADSAGGASVDLAAQHDVAEGTSAGRTDDGASGGSVGRGAHTTANSVQAASIIPEVGQPAAVVVPDVPVRQLMGEPPREVMGGIRAPQVLMGAPPQVKMAKIARPVEPAVEVMGRK